MTDNTINELQEKALLLKGLSGIREIYETYKAEQGDKDILFNPDNTDAMEYFLTTSQKELSNELKQITDTLK